MQVPTISEECVGAFKTPDTLAAIFHTDGHQVTVAKVLPATTTWEDFIHSLSSTDVAWAIINIRYVTTNGGKRLKHCWLSWIPEGFKRASTKETVAVKFMSPMVLSSLRLKCAGHAEHGFHHHAGTMEGMLFDDLLERVSKFERDPIDPASVKAFIEGNPSF
ncbi:hypothetical protein Pelo_2752 [Pelomyxa schiedti]|nr:hypothetical protein Pelo_2752 [Pelomyxa schiedti]